MSMIKTLPAATLWWMAKSVLDASWSTFRGMLEYKARRHQAIFIEANERYTTQTCSCCGCISDSSPKGRAGLRIRQWNCPECGSSHDRDVNAARNILRVGLEHQALVGEISGLNPGEDVKLRTAQRFDVARYNKEDTIMLKKLIIIAGAITALSASVALACPAGTHPVCAYDAAQGRSVCHCVR